MAAVLFTITGYNTLLIGNNYTYVIILYNHGNR